MREDVNDLLDRAAGWYSPSTAPDPASIAAIAGERRRRRRLGAIAVSTVITLGSLVLLIGTLKPGGSQPPIGGGTPSGTQVPASTGQVIGYHGLDVTVPASWNINDMTCGTPRTDTVIRDVGAIAACLVPRPPGISSLELVDNPEYWQPLMQSVRTLTNAHGVRLDQGTVPDRPGMAIYVPAVQVLMFADTVTDAETNAIVDSIQLADTDPNGCAMRAMDLDPPASYQPEASLKGALIPGLPSSIAICHYVDNWLVSSATLTGQEMTDLVGVVNGLPEGFDHAPPSTFDPSICSEPSSAGGELGSGFVMWVSEAGSATLPLWAHIGFCGHLGITNGARDGQLTPELAASLNRPLHAGYVMPGRLIPDPPSN